MKIQNPNGSEFLYAAEGGGSYLPIDNGIAHADDTDYNDFATFLLIDNEDSTFRLRTLDGNYVQILNDGTMSATATEPTAETLFTVADMGNGVYTAEGSNGYYLDLGNVDNNMYSLSFDGTDDYVELSTDVISSSKGTIEHWVKLNTTDTQVMVYTGNSSEDGFIGNNILEIHTGLNSDGEFSFTYQDGNGAKTTISTEIPATINTWYHVAAVWDTDNMMYLYVDGELSAYQDMSGWTFSAYAPNRFYIGRPGKFVRYFNGKMDKVRIWNTARSQSEIQADMYDMLDGTENGLVAYYDFEEGTGDTAIDHNGNVANLMNGTAYASIQQLNNLYLKTSTANPMLGVATVSLEASPAPANNRFVALHASVNEEDENGNDISYEGFITTALTSNYPQVVSSYQEVEMRTFFHFIELGDGTVRIQVPTNGKYLKASGNGGGDVVQGDYNGDGKATFTVVRGLPMMNDDEVMFRTANNHYINITSDGGLEATATTYGQNAVFKVVELEKSHSLPTGEVTIQVASGETAGRYFGTQIGTEYVRPYNNGGKPYRFRGEFNLIDHGDNTISLQSTYGTYLYAKNGGGMSIRYSANDTSDPSTRFEIVRGLPLMAENEILLRVSNGNYINVGNQGHAEGGNWIEATATNYEDATAFIIAQKEPEIAKESKVAIRSGRNNFTATGGYIEQYQYIRNAETFTMLTYDNGDVQFRSKNDTFLSVSQVASFTEENVLHDSVSDAYMQETFKLLPPTGAESSFPGATAVKLQTYYGNCVVVSFETYEINDYSVYTNGDCSSDATDLEIVDLDEYPVYQEVAIKSKLTNKYISAHGGNYWPKIRVKYDQPDSQSYFLMKRKPDNRFHLQTTYGYYLRSITDEEEDGNIDEITGDLTNPKWFEIVFNDDGSVSFKDLNAKAVGTLLKVSNERLYSNGSSSDGDAVSFYLVTRTEEVTLGVDQDTPVGNAIIERLNIPVLGADADDMFTLPNADVTIVQAANKELESLTGITELPELPSMGMLGAGAIGPLEAQGPVSMTIGYDTGSALNAGLDTSFPLNDDLKYFYLSYSTGASVSLGGASISAEGGKLEFAIDHRSPSLFLHTDSVPLFEEAVEAIGIGISGKTNIPYEPLLADIPMVDGNQPTFNGEFWITGTFPVPFVNLPEGGGLSITGDATVSVDMDKFVNSQRTVNINGVSIPVLIPTAAIKQLGINSTLTGSIDVCEKLEGVDCGFEVDLGYASLILNNENQNDPWLSFIGRADDPNNNMKIPFINLKLPSTGPNAYMIVSGYLSKTRQFLLIEGKYDDFGSTGVKLEGLFEISDDNGGQVEFEGTSDFGFERMSVSGLINKNQQIFTGTTEK
ncbi:MAG: LamG-like jellyroll fold domain-containing protein [Candidatus Parabeggiatoa sp.]|nr:LamG-like jellyroll fold domain-containing protein [Candidatus Parabeggiatoa sp.]